MPIYNIWKKCRKGDSPMKLLTKKLAEKYCGNIMAIISIGRGNLLKDNKEADYRVKLYVFCI
jgi:hypothetical protein